MAELAIHAKASLVDILGRVALLTRPGHILEGKCLMTFLAGDDAVHAQKGEVRQLMVEMHLPRPTPIVVTGLASLPLLPPMHIVRAVASMTILRKF